MRVFDGSRPARFARATVLLLLLAGCQKTGDGGKPIADRAPMPAGGPATGGGPMSGTTMTDADGPTDGQAVALKMTGLNSAEELKRAQARLADPALQPTFDAAYRMTFSAKQAQRNYPDAIKLANQVISSRPDFAPAYRVLGYAKFNTNDDTGALAAYRKAVELDPNYGEAEYALAFMYARGDLTEGLKHYKRAIELGVKDERDIGHRFYGIGQ